MDSEAVFKGSFRDPSGFLFYHQGELYRQVNEYYRDNYDLLMNSGLYERLVRERLLIPHTETGPTLTQTGDAYKIIKPEMLGFISYPYEWSFSQLKDAALTTLRIQQIAFEFGMVLKDSSAYNIQFHNGKPVFIDTLSFEKYMEGQPWVAYRQFCQHFLAPLALMSYTDIRLSQLLRIYIDGIPLDLASSLLPGKTKYKFSMVMNIHLHAKAQKDYSAKAVDTKKYRVSKLSFQALVDSLASAVGKLQWKPAGTEWGDYYSITNYSEDSFQYKKELVEKYLEASKPRFVWDLGANTGVFSRIASDKGIETVSFDIDPVAVEKNYLYSLTKKETKILPLILDLTNPTPNLGWNNEERMSFKERRLPDTVFALALIHHLAISNNVPLDKIARFFSEICRHLIIEFVPKSDSQVQRLLATRKDIFGEYDEIHFKQAFSQYFNILASEKIKESERTLYLFQSKFKTS